MRNHLGTYECTLCLTLHNNEASYLAHTQGKKHQSTLPEELLRKLLMLLFNLLLRRLGWRSRSL